MIPMIVLLLAAGSAGAAEGGAATPPRAKSNLAALIRNGDYPDEAVRGREQGIVNFQLDVGADGRVTACRVTASSGSGALDKATCAIMLKRARFVPARDAAGAATSGTVSSRIGWRMMP